MNEFGRALLITMLLTSACLSIYTCGPYFMTPYYSVSDNAQYIDPVPVDIVENDFMFLMTTITSEFSIIYDNDLQLELISVISANFTDPETHKCPTNFFEYLIDNPLHWGPCVQFSQAKMTFLGLDSDEPTIFFANPEDVSQVKVSFADDVPDNQVMLYNGIYQFQNVEDGEDEDQPYLQCDTVADCYDYVADLREANYPIPYEYENVKCFVLEQWDRKGCAVPISIGEDRNCVNEEQLLICEFVVLYSLFIDPPWIFTEFYVWQWGTTAFLNLLFLYVFFSLLHGRNVHLKYVRNYFFLENHMHLQKGVIYEYKLKLTGEQYTERKGTFSLNDRKVGCIYTVPIEVSFYEADLEGERVSTRTFKGTYIPPNDFPNVFFDILWNEEFHSSNSSLSIPVGKLVFRRKIPFFVKSRWNIIFMPVFALLTFITGKWRLLINIPRYFEIVAYFIMIHTVWLVVLINTITNSIPFHNESTYNLFWGTDVNRPVMPIVYYSVFIGFALISVFLGAFTNRKYVRKSVNDTGADEEELERKKKVKKSKELSEDAFIIDRGLEADVQLDETDHTTLEYTPLEEIRGKRKNLIIQPQEWSPLLRRYS